MHNRLTWDDLLIQGVPAHVLRESLAGWAFVLEGEVAPIFLNRFGFWFLRRRDDAVDVLDVFEGRVRRVAQSYETFLSCVHRPDWQEENLMTSAVSELHTAGLVACGSQCYAVSPHPCFGGPNPARGQHVACEGAKTLELVTWQSICRQLLGGPA